MKKFLSMILLCCLVLGLLAGCGGDDGIVSQEEARKIALEALDVSEKDASEIHIHVGTYEDTPCYSFHITVGSQTHEVMVDAVTGEVLHLGESSH